MPAQKSVQRKTSLRIAKLRNEKPGQKLRKTEQQRKGSCRSPSYVDLEVDSSRLIFLGSGWSSFARCLNLRDGDMLCCRFDGESTVTVCAFDPSSNSMDPHLQESSSDDSARSRSPTPSSSTAPSGDSSGGGALSISSVEDLDVKPSIKRVCQRTL